MTRGCRAKLFSLAAALAAVLGRPAHACIILVTPLMPGEDQETYEARIAAERAAQTETTGEHDLEWQRRLWDSSPIVFLARVERIRIGGEIYPRPQLRTTVEDRSPVPPRPVEPTPVTTAVHDAYLAPLSAIKGAIEDSAAWQTVGGRNSCGASSDGDLGMAVPGDELVIFAQHPQHYDAATNRMIDVEELSMTGVARSSVVEPHVLDALGAPPPN